MKILIFTTFLLLFSSLTAIASTKEHANKMRAVALIMSEDSNKIKALNDVSFEYRNFNPKETVKLATQALALGKKINYRWDLARSLNFIGVGYQKLGKQAIALEYYMAAKDAALENNQAEQLAYAYHNMGTIYIWQNDYEKSVELFYKSLKVFEQSGELRGIAYAHNSLSQLALSQGNLDSAIKHASKSLSLRQGIKDKRGEGSSNNRLGEIYIKKGDYDKALIYFFNNIILYQSSDNYEDLALTNMNIGKVYLASKNYTKAIYFGNKSLIYHDKIGNNGVVAEILLLVGQGFYYQKDYIRSKEYCKKSTRFAKEYNRQEVLFQSYLFLSKIAEKQKKYSKALTYHKQYLTLKDSLFNAEMYRQSGLEEGNFIIFKKDQENNLLKQKEAANQILIEKQQLQQWSLVLGLILFSALFLVLVQANHTKKKANLLLQDKNQKIEQQKEAILNQRYALENAQKQLRAYNDDLEKMVEERTNALQKSNEELELYAYMASHDLKQPLRNITGFSQLINRHLKKENIVDATVSKYSNIIIDSTKYMHHLIEDLLAFSKFSSTNNNINFEEVEYEPIIKNVLQNLHQQIQDKNAHIELLNIPESGNGIKIKLIQLFQNLISNALKFSKKDTPAIITIDTKDIGTHYQFSIADNGIGIKEEHFTIIFETFKKLHNKQEYAGVGLGLSICKKIIAQHDGEIRLESVPNEGTTFYFTLAKNNA